MTYPNLPWMQAANTIAAAHPDKPRPPVTALAKLRTDVQVVPTQTGNQLVRRPTSSQFSYPSLVYHIYDYLCRPS